jgi:hypothetical protein
MDLFSLVIALSIGKSHFRVSSLAVVCFLLHRSGQRTRTPPQMLHFGFGCEWELSHFLLFSFMKISIAAETQSQARGADLNRHVVHWISLQT